MGVLRRTLILLAAAVAIAAPQAASAAVTGVGGAISARGYSCAVTSVGAVKCWGDNQFGQVGDGTMLHRSLPVQVTDLVSGATTVAASDNHACAIVFGGVKCWGYGANGQLGDGSTGISQTPVDATGLTSGVTAIATGGSASCAIQSGAAKCWGTNNNGELGDGTSTQRTTPVQVQGLTSGVTAIDIYASHACAVVDGGARCWGVNYASQLGDGTNSPSSTPTQVSGLTSGVTAISAGGSHTCAIVSGAAWCWGSNTYGQLGDASNTASSVPVQVSGLTSGVTAIAAGSDHSCAVQSGVVKCWGSNTYGQLSDVVAQGGSNTPVSVSLASAATDVIAGTYLSCAQLANSVSCWGWNGRGQLGDGTTGMPRTPVEATPLANPGAVTGVSAGGIHTCAIVSSAAKCWGYNDFGQLGNGTTTSATFPQAVTGLTNATDISAGDRHSCAVLSGGAVDCWGINNYGELGSTGGPASTPRAVTSVTSGATLVSAGGNHTCAVVSAGAKCWGRNQSGQLGDGTTTSSLSAVDVSGLSSGVTRLSSGISSTCAVVNSGAKCWGANNNGQLGNGSNTGSTVPVDVQGLGAVSGVQAVDVGDVLDSSGTYSFACAVVSGAARCWGNNSYGQLGNGTYTSSNTPVQVSGLTSNVAQIAAGYRSACAVLTTNEIKCWGDDYFGQLGDDGNGASNTPVSVVLSGLPSAPTSISGITIGYGQACAKMVVSFYSRAYCWGNGSNGNVGDGNAWKPTPVTVLGLTPRDSQPPTVSILTPVNGSTTGVDHVNVTYDTEDNVAVDSCDTSPGQEVPLALGVNTITVTCEDAAGNVGSDSVSVTYADQTPPSVTITSPAAGAVLQSTTPQFSFDASDDIGLDSLSCAIDAGAPVACVSPWTAPALAAGQHQLTVVAADAAGNQATATLGFTIATPSSPGQPALSLPRIDKSPKKVKAGKAVKLTLFCPDGCKISQSLKIGKKKFKGLKAKTVAAGRTSLSLKLTSKATKAVKKALKKNKKTKITLSLTPSSTAGKGASKSVRIVR